MNIVFCVGQIERFLLLKHHFRGLFHVLSYSALKFSSWEIPAGPAPGNTHTYGQPLNIWELKSRRTIENHFLRWLSERTKHIRWCCFGTACSILFTLKYAARNNWYINTRSQSSHFSYFFSPSPVNSKQDITLERSLLSLTSSKNRYPSKGVNASRLPMLSHTVSYVSHIWMKNCEKVCWTRTHTNTLRELSMVLENVGAL